MTIKANENKAVAYCRVSSKEQEETGYSLEAQESLLKEYASNKSLVVDKSYRISESASGKQIRKTFNEMLKHATKNKIPTILCEKIDRLTRNLKDANLIDEWIKEDSKRSVHFIKEGFILNQNTKAHENLVWDMKVAIARFYTNNLSEEVKKGQKEKIKEGWLPTKPPLGYKTIGEKGRKIHVTDEQTEQLVRKMFETYANGNYSIKALIDVMHKEGLRGRSGAKVSRSRIHKYLSDPFYFGKIFWNGTIYQGKHEPLITKELFDIVQEKLSRKFTGPQFKKYLPVFKAKMKCAECGGIISWYMQKGHWYGNCNHFKNCSQHGCLRQEKAEEQLFPYFDKVAPKNIRIMQWLEEALKEDHSEEIKYNNRKKEEYMRIITTADRRLEMAYNDKLDGRMPAGICEKAMNGAINDKECATRELERLGKSRKEYYEAGYAIHELACKARAIYESPKATAEDKRLLLSYVFSDMKLDESKITPNYTLAFEFLTKWVPKVNATFEPEKNGDLKGKTEVLASVQSDLSALLPR